MKQILTKKELQAIAAASGYRIEILEKIGYLMLLLDAINQDNLLKDKLVLKGGTALNLFHFTMPRLSVDIDLNYIGSTEIRTYEKERPEIIEHLNAIARYVGLQPERHGSAHAGGKTVWRYQSALGNSGKIEIDLNFMHRIALLPTCYLPAKIPEGLPSAANVHLLDLHEIAAGKIMALQSRQKSRDVFDVALLANFTQLDPALLRLCVVIYAAIAGLDEKELTQKPVTVERRDFHDQLIPLLTNASLARIKEASYLQQLETDSKRLLASLFPLQDNEKHFLAACLNGDIKPELITADLKLQQKIVRHPSINWHAHGKKLYVFIKNQLDKSDMFISSTTFEESLSHFAIAISEAGPVNTLFFASQKDYDKLNLLVRKILLSQQSITQKKIFSLTNAASLAIGVNDIVLFNDHCQQYQIDSYQQAKISRIEDTCIYVEPLDRNGRPSNREIPIYTPLPLIGYGYVLPDNMLDKSDLKDVAFLASPALDGNVLKKCMQLQKNICRVYYTTADYANPKILLETLKKQSTETTSLISKTSAVKTAEYIVKQEASNQPKPTPYD